MSGGILGPVGLKEAPHDHYTMRPPLDYRDGERLPDMEPSLILEPEQARFRLFDSITNFLKNAASSSPWARWISPSALSSSDTLSEQCNQALTTTSIIGMWV